MKVRYENKSTTVQNFKQTVTNETFNTVSTNEC